MGRAGGFLATLAGQSCRVFLESSWCPQSIAGVAPSGRWSHLVYGSAEVQFLRTDAFHWTDLGALLAMEESSPDDRCQYSCVDWYGNACPIFYRDRICALMGYEIVEGEIRGDRIVEIQRVDYASVD